MGKILEDAVIGQVQDAFAGLKQPVEMLFFGSQNDCEYCPDERQLLQEVAALHEGIGLSNYDLEADRETADRFHIDKAPVVVIAGRDGEEIKDFGIRFSGVPSGHEFATLINDILLVSNRDSGLSQKTRDYLKGIAQPLLLQVFVTPT